jgi:hypothetical protein
MVNRNAVVSPNSNMPFIVAAKTTIAGAISRMGRIDLGSIMTCAADLAQGTRLTYRRKVGAVSLAVRKCSGALAPVYAKSGTMDGPSIGGGAPASQRAQIIRHFAQLADHLGGRRSRRWRALAEALRSGSPQQHSQQRSPGLKDPWARTRKGERRFTPAGFVCLP